MTNDDGKKPMITAEEMKGIIAEGIAPVSQQIKGLHADISSVKERTDFIERRVDKLEDQQAEEKEFTTAAIQQFEAQLASLAGEGKTERSVIKGSLERIESWTNGMDTRIGAMESGHAAQQKQLDTHSSRFDSHSTSIHELKEQQLLTHTAVGQLARDLADNQKVAVANSQAIARTEKNTETIAEIAGRLDNVRKMTKYVAARGLSGGAGASLVYYVLQLILSLIGAGE